MERKPKISVTCIIIMTSTTQSSNCFSSRFYQLPTCSHLLDRLSWLSIPSVRLWSFLWTASWIFGYLLYVSTWMSDNCLKCYLSETEHVVLTFKLLSLTYFPMSGNNNYIQYSGQERIQSFSFSHSWNIELALFRKCVPNPTTVRHPQPLFILFVCCYPISDCCHNADWSFCFHP